MKIFLLTWFLVVFFLGLFFIQPVVSDIPDSVSYEKYVTLIHDQDSHGGCVGYSMTHVIEILKEMEAPYSPDPSYGFLDYVWTSATQGKSLGIVDNRVVDNPGENAWSFGSKYGAATESGYPTNFDKYGETYNSLLQHPPDQNVFDEALNYRIIGKTNETIHPTVQDAEEMIATQGPVICNELFHEHAVALIGYDRGKNEFTIVDSANMMNINHAGIKKVPYSYFSSRKDNITLQSVTDLDGGVIDPYTARIKIHHFFRRCMLTIKIGAVGEKEFVTVWDQNDKDLYPDMSQDLTIDVPLPDYAEKHWPPSEENKWIISVENHDPVTNAELQEVTLVKRNTYPASESNQPPDYAGKYEAYNMEGLPRMVPSGTTMAAFPVGITVTSQSKHENWKEGEQIIVNWTQTGLSGTKFRVDLVKSEGAGTWYQVVPSVPACSIDNNNPITPEGIGGTTFIVPPGLEANTDYYVQVSSTDYPEIKNISKESGVILLQAALQGSKIIKADNVMDNIKKVSSNMVNLVIEDVNFTRREIAGKPDMYYLTFSVKNTGGKTSDPTNIGYCLSWEGYEGGVTAGVLKPYVDVPSIKGGETVKVDKSFEEDKTGKVHISSIKVNVADPGCFGDNCIPADEMSYNDNGWPNSYTIPDTVNSTLMIYAKINPPYVVNNTIQTYPNLSNISKGKVLANPEIKLRKI